MAFFSIIIPVYNVEKYLERCLESILADSCKDMEIILVDDGSTDNSGKICDYYSSNYSSIRVVHKPNGGLSSARNAGLNEATGEWISFIDSDDWVDKDCYKTTRDLLAKPENRTVDMVKLGYKKVLNDYTVSFTPCISEGVYEGDAIRDQLLKTALGSRRISNSTMNTIILSSCAHLYRRQFLQETGVKFVSEREIGSEDFLFIYSLYMRASKVLVTKQQWYNYDTREGSLTCRYRNQLYRQYRKLAKYIRLQMEETGLFPAMKADYECMYISLIYICVINECNYSEGRIRQIQNVRNILRDKHLQKYLRSYRSSDRKSWYIAEMMRLQFALPLCVIQWKKSGY